MKSQQGGRGAPAGLVSTLRPCGLALSGSCLVRGRTRSARGTAREPLSGCSRLPALPPGGGGWTSHPGTASPLTGILVRDAGGARTPRAVRTLHQHFRIALFGKPSAGTR